MQTLLKVVSVRLRQALNKLTSKQKAQLQEIRLRVHQPVMLKLQSGEYGLDEEGICKPEVGMRMTQKELIEILQTMSGFSLYALEDELRQGYLTIEGGHRVGLSGKMVTEAGHIKTIQYVSGMNIRIAHEVIGCSEGVMRYILSRDKPYHTLIISPPGCGKTTLLRDIIRQLSNGCYGYGPYTVGVVDERSEIAACYQGVPQNDVGMRTDVLDGCPKVEGMRMLVRAMSPQVVAVDEISGHEDCTALYEMLSAGVSIICTAHGRDEQECLRRPMFKEMLTSGMFERIIILSQRKGPCTIEAIKDGVRQMKDLWVSSCGVKY